MRLKPWAISVLVAATLCAHPVSADCEGTGPQILSAGGLEGLWFDAPQARCLLKASKDARKYRLISEVLQEQTGLKTLRILNLEKQVDLLLARNADIFRSLEEQAAETEEATSWYYHPLLWVVVGAGVTGFAVFTINELQ